MNPNLVYTKRDNGNFYYGNNNNGMFITGQENKRKTVIKKMTLLPCIPSFTYTYRF